MAWTETQRAVLTAACDAIFQALSGSEAADLLAIIAPDAPAYQKENVEYLIRNKYSDLPQAMRLVEEQYVGGLSSDKLAELSFLLSLLSTRAGSMALTGHLTPFVHLSPGEREKVLQAWSISKVPLRRAAFRGFATIALFSVYTNIDKVALATGYPALGDPTRGLDATRIRSHHPYKFESPAPFFETDVLVIGSGSGGGVVSSQLAQKGWKTLVLEKGKYVRPEEIAGTPRHGLENLYESKQSKGMGATEDGSISFLAGSTFGGGTTVNWCASLAPQHFLREEWGNEHGLAHFLSPKFTESIDFVQARMGVSAAHLSHNKANSRLVDGAIKLGYPVSSLPQNTNGYPHPCGFCSFGCPYCEKHGGTVTWLADAASAGSKFLTSATVETLLFSSSSTKLSPKPTLQTLSKFTHTSSRRRCIGAVVQFENGEKGIVLAKEAVVVCAGSLHSPAVLKRSGLKNPRIGKNLRLHPTSYVTGYYAEKINPWEGAIMTSVSTVVENRDGTHHGCKIEVNMSFPGGTAGAFQKWASSKEHKAAMLQMSNSFTLIAISRDRGSGEIILDKTGHPRVSYILDPYDGLSLLSGIIAGAEIHLAAGATRISTTQSGVRDYCPAEGHAGLADPRWREWVAEVKRKGVWGGQVGMGSAHQMGSCQMGTKPTTSVVDARGRVWGTEDLYVADASVFPTASGVNPMITVMSTAHSISQFIDEDLRTKAAKTTRAAL